MLPMCTMLRWNIFMSVLINSWVEAKSQRLAAQRSSIAFFCKSVPEKRNIFLLGKFFTCEYMGQILGNSDVAL